MRIVAAPHLVRRRVEAQVPGRHHGRALAPAASQQGAQPGDEHHERERLGEEVVGAGVEGPGLLRGAGPGSEHQDGRPVPGFAAPGAQDVPGHLGEHDVEDQGVVLVLGGEPLALTPVQRHVDGVPLALEAALERAREVLVVLDDEDPHAAQRVTVGLNTA